MASYQCTPTPEWGESLIHEDLLRFSYSLRKLHLLAERLRPVGRPLPSSSDPGGGLQRHCIIAHRGENGCEKAKVHVSHHERIKSVPLDLHLAWHEGWHGQLHEQDSERQTPSLGKKILWMGLHWGQGTTQHIPMYSTGAPTRTKDYWHSSPLESIHSTSPWGQSCRTRPGFTATWKTVTQMFKKPGPSHHKKKSMQLWMQIQLVYGNWQKRW